MAKKRADPLVLPRLPCQRVGSLLVPTILVDPHISLEPELEAYIARLLRDWPVIVPLGPEAIIEDHPDHLGPAVRLSRLADPRLIGLQPCPETEALLKAWDGSALGLMRALLATRPAIFWLGPLGGGHG